MESNRVREKLRSGQPSLGVFLGLGSPAVAELFGHAGFEWIVIEMEHNGLDMAEVEQMVRAVDTTGAVPIVRVPSHDPIRIQRCLDVGAKGVVVPQVKTADEARAIVAATRYPPEGIRGWGPLRASRYTFDDDDYTLKINDNVIVVLILETREALQNLEEISSVPGVDAWILGPRDLALSLGLSPIRLPHPETEAAAEKMLEVGRRTGVSMGIGSSTPDGLRDARRRGFTFLRYASDYALLANVARDAVGAFRSR